MSTSVTPPVIDSTKMRAPRPRASAPPRPAIPPLNNGDHLSLTEFERRYQARPDIKKAELIEGVVHMPSPVHLEHHAQLHGDVITWLGVYRAVTPGVYVADNATVRLDLDNEVQPDALLRLDEALGGKAHVTDDDFLAGPPELIVEIAASSAAYDLHDKLHVYRRNGVQEYLVLMAYEQQAVWYALQEGVYHPLTPDDQGVLRSQVFPGLHFQPERFWAGDLAGLLAVLQQGLDAPEHTAFVARLQQTG
jgi:Uma2 family endonuclease